MTGAGTPARRFLITDEMGRIDEKEGSPGYGLPVPYFTMQDLSKIFFCRTRDWLRWLHRSAPNYQDGHFVLDGQVLTPKRTAQGGYRAYSLADVERLALALHQDGRLTGDDLAEIFFVIVAIAVRYKIFTWDDQERLLKEIRTRYTS